MSFFIFLIDGPNTASVAKPPPNTSTSDNNALKRFPFNPFIYSSYIFNSAGMNLIVSCNVSRVLSLTAILFIGWKFYNLSSGSTYAIVVIVAINYCKQNTVKLSIFKINNF